MSNKRQTFKIIAMIQLKTREWERLLSPEQQQKYRAAIHKGYFNNYHGPQWRHTFYGGWIWKHPNRVKIISRFAAMIGHMPDWEDITADNLRDLRMELDEEYAPNSVKTICAELAAYIRSHGDKNIPIEFTGMARIMKSKRVPSVSTYLTTLEVERINMYHPKTVYNRFVKRIFMIECLTGARFCDCLRLSPDNIIERDGVQYLRYVAQKTNTEVMVPVHRLLPQYLVKTSPLEPRDPSLANFNKRIREMCHWCGIVSWVKVYHGGKEYEGRKYHFVSTHTGRRSFATNLARKGVTLEQIALMMGHMNGNVPNIEMTKRYVCEKLEIDKKVLRFFQ